MRWTSIPITDFKREIDLGEMMVVADFRYHDRMQHNVEHQISNKQNTLFGAAPRVQLVLPNYGSNIAKKNIDYSTIWA